MSKTSTSSKGSNCSNKRSRSRGNGKPITKQMNRYDSTKTQREAKEIVDTGIHVSESNPVSFYTKFADYARDAANLPFSMPLGTPINFNLQYNYQQFNLKWFAPGLMRLRFQPSIGVSEDFTSPINQTSIKFWTYLRSIQKAAAKYDHQDITMMVLALDSAIMFHALMRRVYGLLGDYTPINMYYPRTIVQACGFDYDDLKANIADFRLYINQFAYNLQQYALPAGITLFDRHRWMCEGLYTDSKAAKAQTYVFVPAGFYKYNNTVGSGSQLTIQDWIPQANKSLTHTFAEVKAFGDALINAFSNDEDFAYISGDLYTFTEGRTYAVPYLDENYKVVPVYDETVLSQIENATIVGPLENTQITQDPSVNNGAILYNPIVVAGDHLQRYGALMNFHKDSPTSDDVIEASRLIATVELAGTTQSGVYLSSCGSEIVIGADVYSRNPATGKFRYNSFEDMSVFFNASTTVDELGDILQDILLLNCFDWAPRIELYNITGDTSADSGVIFGTTWDVDNFTPVQSEYLEQIQRASLMSLFVVGSGY